MKLPYSHFTAKLVKVRCTQLSTSTYGITVFVLNQETIKEAQKLRAVTAIEI